MFELDYERIVDETAGIGNLLRTRWQAGHFHAVISITVPLQQFDIHGLPLTIDEKIRARRFRKTMDCNRSVMGWIVLRNVAGVMLNQQPENVNIIRASNGKPFLERGPGISLSHSGELAVVAFSSETDIGVDIEEISENAEFLVTIMGVLSTQELACLPADNVARSEFLYRAWTRKEAAAKALGRGLTEDFTKLSVADQDGRFECWSAENEPITGNDLQLRSGYSCSLASKTVITEVDHYHIDCF